MAKTLFFVLAAVLFVAALAADVEEENNLEDFFLTEKRGTLLKKYKYCGRFGQDCWCGRRTGKVVFCSGAGNGEGM